MSCDFEQHQYGGSYKNAIPLCDTVFDNLTAINLSVGLSINPLAPELFFF